MPIRASVPAAVGRFLRGALPRGRTLPQAAWSRRHHWVLVLLWLNAVGLFAFSAARGNSLVHSVAEGASSPPSDRRSVLARTAQAQGSARIVGLLMRGSGA